MKFYKPNDMEMNSFVDYYVALAGECVSNLVELKSAFLALLFHVYRVITLLFLRMFNGA